MLEMMEMGLHMMLDIFDVQDFLGSFEDWVGVRNQGFVKKHLRQQLPLPQTAPRIVSRSGFVSDLRKARKDDLYFFSEMRPFLRRIRAGLWSLLAKLIGKCNQKKSTFFFKLLPQRK